MVMHLIYKFTTFVCDGPRVRHRRTTGPGPAKTGEGLTGCDGGQHGQAGHGRVPAGTRALCHGRGANWLLSTPAQVPELDRLSPFSL
jgi:hypothetical protein